jgi:hypothetical protein
MLFGVRWDDAIAARWSANPLGMLWPGLESAGPASGSTWKPRPRPSRRAGKRRQTSARPVSSRPRQAAISSPVRPQARQRPDALSIWQMPTQVKEAWSGASLLRRPAVGTSAQACKTALRPTCRVVQELAEAPGTRACIRLVSGASGKDCAGGGHIGAR